MKSKLLVRFLIVLLVAFFVFRIHQRIEKYRVPQDECRNQLTTLSGANIKHMYEENGAPAISLDSLLIFATDAGLFSAEINGSEIVVTTSEQSRILQVPPEWESLWNETAVVAIQNSKDNISTTLAEVELFIADWENGASIDLDSLISLREIFIEENTDVDDDADSLLSPSIVFDDSIGFNADSLLNAKTALQASVDSIAVVLTRFNEYIAPARQDSVARLAFAVCPSLWSEGYYDSVYSYDAKLALGTQYALSCPNHDRHGCVVGGLIEGEYPDTLFEEPDWSDMQTVYAFAAFAEERRIQVSRSNLLRAAEEQAAFLAQRYPEVLKPKDPEDLEMNIDNLEDPLGGEYVFSVTPDTTYTFFENPGGRSRTSRGDSIVVETWMFTGYTTSNEDTSKVEVFISHPLQFPSRVDGAVAGDCDYVEIIKYWDRSELGTLQTDKREVDLLDEPVWDFLVRRFSTDTPDTP